MSRDTDKLVQIVQSLFSRSSMQTVGSVSLVLDHGGNVAYYNLPAQRVLSAGDGLALSREGKLVAKVATSAKSLSRAIKEGLATDCDEGDRDAAVVQVERLSGKPAYLVYLWPCLQGETGPNSEPGLLVVVNDPEQSELSIQRLLTQLYELTPSEAQVAMHLLHGESAKQIAEARDVAITTVRTQIRNLLMKTDTQRQSEFIALVFRCLSLMLR